MFLFLSKLLPLFVYPLGLACLLTVAALWNLRKKRSDRSAMCMVLALVVILLGANGWVAVRLTQSLEWQNLPSLNVPNADAIVVLGGSIKPQAYPRPAVDVSESGDRVLYGAQLFRQGKAPVVIMSGGRIDWKGGGTPEAEDMTTFAEMLGVPKSAILQDLTSLNTHENAVNVQQILQQRKLKKVLLVTSALHMPRSLRIFKKLGVDVIAAPTDFQVTQQDLYEPGSSLQAIALNLLPDADRLQQTTRALKEYIGIFIYWLRGWV